MGRLKDMKSTLPFEWKQAAEEHIQRIVQAVYNNCEGQPPHVLNVTIEAPITINANTITDSPHASITTEAAPKAEPKPKAKRARKKKEPTPAKLHFLLIKDDRLSLDDRIVMSLLWKYAKIGKVGANIETLRNFTGFHPHTIIGCLLHLVAFGYIDADQKVLAVPNPLKGKIPLLTNGQRLLGTRPMEWINDGKVREQVARGIINTNKEKQSRPSWLAKALGVSRATAYRYLKTIKKSGEGVVIFETTPKSVS